MGYVSNNDYIQSSDMNTIIADVAELENKLNNLELNASKIILSMDDQYCEQVINKMESKQIEVLLDHLEKLKLLSEKVLFDRT